MSISQVSNVKPSAWDELEKINFYYAVSANVERKNYARPVCQNIITFDIETSNGHITDGVAHGFDHDRYAADPDFYDNAEHQGLMYIWQVAIETNTPEGVKVFVGRTWTEYRDFMEKLALHIYGVALLGRPASEQAYKQVIASCKQSKNRPEFRVYVHNFPFEFQHLRNLFNDEFAQMSKKRAATFARKARKPLKSTININGVKATFCDTLCLTVKSLAKWCEDSKLPTQKLEVPEGYYDVIRTPITPLTDFELQYAVNDVVSMVYGIENYREKYDCLQDIPMTQTGEVRLTCRDRVAFKDTAWAKQMFNITMETSFELYRVFVKTFCGGWTHANAYRTGYTWRNVRCFDFASSYPWVMTAFTFPISTFQETDPTLFDSYTTQDPRSLDCETHFIARIHFHELKRAKQNTYWSSSKVEAITAGAEIDNGKISYAEDMTAYMTDVDFQIMQEAYTWDWLDVEELYVAQAGMLSKELILTILDYYSKKTKLKGTGQDSLYNESKQFTNSIYGVSVTKVYADDVLFGETGDGVDWYSDAMDEDRYYEKQLETKLENSFLTYQIGPYITAFARSNLWTILKDIDAHTIYGDTDSLKGVYDTDDMAVIEAYNQFVLDRQEDVAARLGFSVDLYRPLKKSKEPDILGYFDEEAKCEEFKTLGAKRYMDIIKVPLADVSDIKPLRDTWQGIYDKKTVHIVRMDNENAYLMQATIAGLPKRSAYMNIDTLSDFKSGRKFSTKESGKQIAFYNDNQTPAVWVDEYGNEYQGEDRYGICIMPTTFSLELSDEYEYYLGNLLGYDDGISQIFY